MKRNILLFFFLGLLFFSCKKEEDTFPVDTDQTVFFYMPWSSDLLDNFYQNIADLKTGIAENGLRDERVLVFLQTSTTEAQLFEIKYNKGECIQEIIKEYTSPAVTTAQGIASILKDVTFHAPAKRYGMVVSCHGMSWLPVGSTKGVRSIVSEHTGNDAGLPTRYFGGQTTEFQTEVSDLVKGIQNAGLKMEYILFDDCYMSSIEVVYDLKEVTDYFVASPCEVLVYGMPYHTIAKYMIGEVDYENICIEILTFYQNYTYPYVTIATTVCSELDQLAAIMKEINKQIDLSDPSLVTSVQKLDGYSPSCFFDLEDYVSKVCPDEALQQKFKTQLARAVPVECRMATEYFITKSRGRIKLDTYSGMTISDPSTNIWTATKEDTNWYKATH